jgi:hypothetical protein
MGSADLTFFNSRRVMGGGKRDRLSPCAVRLRSGQIRLRAAEGGEGFIITKSNIFYDLVMREKKTKEKKAPLRGSRYMLSQIT